LYLGVRAEAADPEVAEPDDGVVILEREKGLGGWAAERVGENQFIVEPVFDAVRKDDDTGFVENVRGGVGLSGGGVNSIE